MNLRYTMLDAPSTHPQLVLHDLGIEYRLAVPQTVADQWWFFGCTNVPQELPEYLTLLNITPQEAVGHGLSQEQADKLSKE